MPSPFPGMDPYLESPELWGDVHHALIEQLRVALNPRLRPKYIARVELRVYVSDDDDPGRRAMVPDVRIETRRQASTGAARAAGPVEVAEPLEFPLLLDETIEEAYLTIKDRESDALVGIIEVVSPTNKVAGSRGRTSFLDKKAKTLAGGVHWVEIDLLREGERSPTAPPLVSSDYRVTVYRHGNRRSARYWPIQLRQRLPVIGIPLRKGDPDVSVDLDAVLRTAYEVGEYDATIDYRRPPVPPLGPADARWASRLLRKKGPR